MGIHKSIPYRAQVPQYPTYQPTQGLPSNMVVNEGGKYLVISAAGDWFFKSDPDEKRLYRMQFKGGKVVGEKGHELPQGAIEEIVEYLQRADKAHQLLHPSHAVFLDNQDGSVSEEPSPLRSLFSPPQPKGGETNPGLNSEPWRRQLPPGASLIVHNKKNLVVNENGEYFLEQKNSDSLTRVEFDSFGSLKTDLPRETQGALRDWLKKKDSPSSAEKLFLQQNKGKSFGPKIDYDRILNGKTKESPPKTPDEKEDD